jgi:hypothetical protein
MKVTFEPAASDELDRIFAWIPKDSPGAALNTIAHRGQGDAARKPGATDRQRALMCTH